MDWREVVVIIVAVALVAFALATPFVRSYRRKKGKSNSCCGGKCSDCKYGGCPYCDSAEHEKKSRKQNN